MHFPLLLAALVALDFSLLASAGVYFIQPASGSTCTAGSPCTIEWVDDGISPLLNRIEVVTAGLLHGEQQLVQSIPALNVANSHSIQFTPNAKAGPDSSAYYIAFESTSATVNSTQYIAFSPFFTLKGMSGSFASPLAAATSSLSIPSPLSGASSGGTIATTIVIGSPQSSSLFPSPTAAVVTPSSKSSSPSATVASTPSSSPSINSPSPSISSSSSRFAASSIPTPSAASNTVASSPGPASSSAASSDASNSSRPLSLPVLAAASLWLVLSIS